MTGTRVKNVHSTQGDKLKLQPTVFFWLLCFYLANHIIQVVGVALESKTSLHTHNPPAADWISDNRGGWTLGW